MNHRQLLLRFLSRGFVGAIDCVIVPDTVANTYRSSRAFSAVSGETPCGRTYTTASRDHERRHGALPGQERDW